jgi:hypothetical protein
VSNVVGRSARCGAVLALFVVVGVAIVGGRLEEQPAFAAAGVETAFVSSFDGSGTFTFGGQPTFPIALSNPPPLDGVAPDGGNGLDEVVRAGVTVLRVGPMPLWPREAIPSIEAWDTAALPGASTPGSASAISPRRLRGRRRTGCCRRSSRR